ncbi:MAG: SAM-dependent chlorinase/fluorinase [Pseudomonadota bacterium]|nr:SAM-dependent chlorinase/fluorinase [Pseudomonadota bacterium]
MIFLFTDFGADGPYVGQMRAAIARVYPDVAVVDLCHDLPPFRPRSAAYLLAALVDQLPVGAIVVGVVDPGVGSERRAVVLTADGRCFIGPDNGLFSVVARRADQTHWRELIGARSRLSATFHGRDVFAPAAARVVAGQDLETAPMGQPAIGLEWPEDLAEIIYVDHYGNAMTGLRASHLKASDALALDSHQIPFARTFSDVPAGAAFWYENSNGLVEIAVNQGRADGGLGLRVGSPVRVYPSHSN